MDISLLGDLKDLFQIKQEPEYSRSILLELQKKYNISTEAIYNHYEHIREVDLDIDENDLEKWIFNLRIYIKAGGDIWDLNPNCIDEEEYFKKEISLRRGQAEKINGDNGEELNFSINFCV